MREEELARLRDEMVASRAAVAEASRAAEDARAREEAAEASAAAANAEAWRLTRRVQRLETALAEARSAMDAFEASMMPALDESADAAELAAEAGIRDVEEQVRRIRAAGRPGARRAGVGVRVQHAQGLVLVEVLPRVAVGLPFLYEYLAFFSIFIFTLTLLTPIFIFKITKIFSN